MKTTQRVVWSEGLLMSPQHMQQLDLYHEGLIGARVEALEPLNWGVLTCKIDRRALSTGNFQLLELTGVLPYGTALALGPGDPEIPASRPVEGHFPHTQPMLEVFIGLPKERDGIANYSNDGGSARVRYVVTSRAVPDLTGGADPINVPFAQRNAVILFGSEPRDDYEHMKIAEVVRDDAGALTVSDPYIPPILRISASPFVIDGLRRLLRLMVTRRRSLSEARRMRDEATIEFNATDVTRFLFLNAINTFMPVMNYMVDAQDIPPRACYLLLTQFAGGLATFSADFDPGVLPKFVYTDLRATFEELFARITALLQAADKEYHVAMKLDSRADGMHIGQIQDDRLFTAERFFLAVRSTVGEQEIATQLPRLSKIASWGDINGILSAATPGSPVEVTYRPPPEIPIKARVVYFTIATENAYWRNIMSERKVAVYLPRPFDPATTQLELLAIPRKKS